jgi:hypothetical protein
MDPDKYQQAWQAEASQTRVTIDADLLLEEVQRQLRNFRAMIFWRDFREIGIALLMIPAWFYLGITTSSPWTWYLAVPALLWVIGFLLVDRRRHTNTPNDPGEPLLDCVQNSLTQVEHQIWLLRNVFWWYLLPFTIPLLTFFIHVTWRTSDGRLEAVTISALLSVFLLVVDGFIYYLNQYAVRKQLEPHRRELLTLLASLQDEPSGTGADEQVNLPALPFAEDGLQTPCPSPARAAVGNLTFMIIIVLVVGAAVVMVNTAPSGRTDNGYSLRSPFGGVRWQGDQPEVQVEDEWFELVSLDKIPASDIVAFSQETYGDKWRKRFEEDLVELLTRMGHPPGGKVTLVVQSLTSPETQTLEDVPMTYANRRAIREAAQARERVDSP